MKKNTFICILLLLVSCLFILVINGASINDKNGDEKKDRLLNEYKKHYSHHKEWKNMSKIHKEKITYYNGVWIVNMV
jgi:hypothetical protein